MTAQPRILIVLTGSLGDLARATAMVTAIKKQWQECHITWLVDSIWANFLELSDSIDQLIVFDRKRPIQSFLITLRKLYLQKFDICLDLQRILKSGIFSLASRAKQRIGFARQNAKELNYIFNNCYIAPRDERSCSKLEQYLDFLQVLGLTKPHEHDFGIQVKTAKVDLANILPNTTINLVAVILGSSWSSKNWTYAGYQQLLEKLLSTKDCHIALIGGRSDQPLANQLTSAIPNPRILDLTAKTNLKQLAAVLQRCSVCIGPDSGPGHIAAALNVPVVSIFGPTIPARVAPYNSLNGVVSIPVECGPCLQRTCPGFGNICTHNISAQMVFDRTIAVLQSSVTMEQKL